METARRLASNMGVQARNPKWTSYGALEVDVFAPTKADFQLFLAAMEPLAGVEFQRDLSTVQGHLSVEETFEEARRLFNSERYWESHEVLEGAWRTLEGKEKTFTQGVILVCAAFVHHQKGEEDIALGVLARANRQLSYPRNTYHGIDVRKLTSRAEEILSTKEFREFRI